MILDSSNNVVSITGNNVEQQTMQIKINSKAFGLMIDGLYQDKYGSVVRELASNAYDAHVSCGKEHVPFDITIPSEVSSIFSIRDYGQGLEKKDIVLYFGTLFETNKDGSNKTVGAYGLGCKSPFSVVDEFSVTSIKDGIKTVVIFAREDKGTPTFFVATEAKTDQPSGTEVIINSNSIHKWENAIAQQLPLFPTRPNIFGGNDQGQELFGKIETVGELKFIFGLARNIYISMGPVLYPIDPKDFPGSSFINSKFGSTVYSCNIGDITVPPDRERIYLTEKNIETITEVINRQNDTYFEKIKTLFSDEYKGTYESYKEVSKFAEQFHDGLNQFHKTVKNHVVPKKNLDLLVSLGHEFDPENLSDVINLNFHTKLMFKTSITKYVGNNGQMAAEGYTRTSLCAILSSKLPIVISHNLRVYELYNLVDKFDKNPEVLFIRMKKAHIDWMVDLLKSAAPYFEYDESKIIVNSADMTNKKPAVSKGPKVKGSIKGISKQLGAYNFKEIIEEADIDNYEKGNFVMFSMGRSNKLRNSNMTLAEIYATTQYSNIPIFFVKHTMYREVRNAKPNALTEDDLVKSILQDENKVYNIFLERGLTHRYLENREYKYPSYKKILKSNVDNIAKILMGSVKIKNPNQLFEVLGVSIPYKIKTVLDSFEFKDSNHMHQSVSDIINRSI